MCPRGDDEPQNGRCLGGVEPTPPVAETPMYRAIEACHGRTGGDFQDSDVSKPASSSQPTPIYNLQGQRQDMLQRGVNIVGNQKKMVK